MEILFFTFHFDLLQRNAAESEDATPGPLLRRVQMDLDVMSEVETSRVRE